MPRHGDRDGAKLVLAKLLGRFPRLQVIWADAGYAGRLVEWERIFANPMATAAAIDRVVHHSVATGPGQGGGLGLRAVGC